jgi:hypothetical protein
MKEKLFKIVEHVYLVFVVNIAIANYIDLCMKADERKHKVWLACMKLSNCTPEDAVNFINMA